MKKFFLFLVSLFFVNTAHAAIYKLDPEHTNITWSANHFGFSNPSGKFTESTGFVIIDEDNPLNSSVEITIKTKSVQSGFANFDTHLKSANFLNVEKYPEAKFVSKNLVVQGRRAQIIGDFTFLGITKTITLDTKLNRIGLNSYTQKKTAGFSASTSFKRSDFGMDFGIPGISDKVKIDIEVEAILDPTAKDKPITKEDKSAKQDALFPKGFWKVVPNASSIKFAATRDNEVIKGSFKKFSGRIDLSPSDLTKKNAVAIDIDTSSIECSFDNAISVLKTSDWLDFTQFPKANFVATKFIKTPSNQIIAKGELTLKGRTAPVEVIFNIGFTTEDSATATGFTTIKRSDFDIGNKDINKAGNIKDEIQITFSLTAKR